MQVLFLILPLALVIAVVFVIIFAIALKRGQFDDLDTPSHRMLLNDEEVNNLINNLLSKPSFKIDDMSFNVVILISKIFFLTLHYKYKFYIYFL